MRDSGATLIISTEAVLNGGSKQTQLFEFLCRIFFVYLSLGGVQKALNTARLYQGGSVANPEGTSQPFQVQRALQAVIFN